MPAEPSWNPWLISSVAIICSCILIFTYYKILRDAINRLQSRSLSRNPTRRHVLDELNPDFPSLQFHSQGLDFSVTRSLPVKQFKKRDEGEAEPEEHNESNTDCAVCLGEFEDGEWLKQLPKCSHEFHISCIDTWFVSHSNCPLCRTQVYDFMHEFLVRVETPPEALRDDDIQERESHYQTLRAAILRNSPIGSQARDSGFLSPNQTIRETIA